MIKDHARKAEHKIGYTSRRENEGYLKVEDLPTDLWAYNGEYDY